jgi:hypothetical protein
VLNTAKVNEISCSYEEALKLVAPSAPAAGD